MTSYEQTKAGWDNAAKTNADAAIHPAGLQGKKIYEQSGSFDVDTIIAALNQIDPTRLENSPTIIDYGCGNGRVSLPLSIAFSHVYAIDCSYEMLQQLPRDTNITPVLSVDNWFGLPEPADFAFSISVFIHNNHNSGLQMMKAISENLKPGGIALLQIPIYDYSREPANWTDVGVWSIEQFKHCARISGFSILETHVNPGHFTFSNIGKNHHRFQVLQKM